MPTYVFHPVTSVRRPTWLWEGDPTTPYYDGTMVLGRPNYPPDSLRAHGLMTFDISSLTGTVTEASLELPRVDGGTFGGHFHRVIRVFRNRRGTWTHAFASWQRYDNGLNWTTPGGTNSINDYDPSLFVDFTMPDNLDNVGQPLIISGPSFTALVQDALDNRAGMLHLIFFPFDVAGSEFMTFAGESAPILTVVIGTVAPTVQATNIIAVDTFETALNLSWTRGDGEACVLFAKTGDSGSAVPVDGTTYTSGASFGSGTQIGSSGWYSVYVGTAGSAALLGLTPNTNYRFHVCEYNGAPGSELYNISNATGNPVTIRTALLSGRPLLPPMMQGGLSTTGVVSRYGR